MLNLESVLNATIEAQSNIKAQATVNVPRETKSNLFTVESLPITSDKYGVIPGKKGLYVEGRNINIVSNKYEIHQPNEIVDTFRDVASQSGLTVDKVIPNTNNGGLLLSANLGGCKILGEQHQANLCFYTSHCGKYKTFLTLDFLRIACHNQVPRLYRNKSRFIFAEKHYRNALDLKLIESVLEELPAQIEAQNELSEKLAAGKFDFEAVRKWYIERNKLKEESKQFESKMQEFKDTYFFAPGQQELEESKYKALQAITYLNTHKIKNTAGKLETQHITNATDSLDAIQELLYL